MADVSGFMGYAEIHDCSETTKASMMLDAAKEWFRNSGVPVPAVPSTLYDLGVYMLALHYYDNRGVLTASEAELPFGVMAIMHQLKLTPSDAAT